MILYDGIVYRLQKFGGISVLFNEIIKRMPENSYKLVLDSDWRFFERFRKFKSCSEFDLFHSTYYRIPLDDSAPIVTTVHDFTYERFVKGFKKEVHVWQKRKAIEAADIIICVSESTKNDLLYYLGATYEDRIAVVHNGVSHDYRPLSDIALRDQVIYVGSRLGYKNFQNLVKALSFIEGVSLVCVGGGEFSNNELEILNRLIPDRFCFKGLLSNEELNQEYNKSICLVYPSLYEGFGIPVLEAMRAGCPVLAVNSSSIPEVAGQAAFLMEVGAVEEIRDGIEFFCVRENRQKFVRLGTVRAQEFSWDLTFNKTVAVYEKLLGREI